MANDDDQNNSKKEKVGLLQRARNKFMARPVTYLLIPVIAAIVGWFTNYLAVQMIFYPIEYGGISLWRKPEVPLGFIGWQGIVPCKTETMSVAVCEMVTTQLLTVKEAFSRLDPRQAAELLAPATPSLGLDLISDLRPEALTSWPASWLRKVQSTGGKLPSFLQFFQVRFLTGVVRDMQQNIDSIFSLQDCVVSQMVQDRAKLGELFRKVGHKELDFLTNSGLWFGFLLGLIQMAVALFYDNPWTLSIGGGIVGLATNWLALKWIFEPVNPTKIGPFILQGQFLRRQKEVAAEFSKFFSEKILASPQLWNSMCTNPSTTPAFVELLKGHFSTVCHALSLGSLKGRASPEMIQQVSTSVMEKLPKHVGGLHTYIDKTLGLEKTLRVRMEAMSAAKFERVLHPIFEEDELTLILAGAVLGFAAGLVQQGLETGAIQFKSPLPLLKRSLQAIKVTIARVVDRIRGGRAPPNSPEEGLDEAV